METRSNTPDFILARYLTDCLEAFDRATVRRDEYYDGGAARATRTNAAVLRTTAVEGVKGPGEEGALWPLA